MELTNIIRVTLIAICFFATLFFLVLAISNKNKRKRSLKFAGLSFVAIFLFNVLIIKLQTILYKPTNKLGQLTFLAFGQTTNNEKGWLGLYNDSTWEFGKSYREIETNGSYYIKGDTVFLTEASIRVDIIIVKGEQIESSDPKLNGLKVEMNDLN